MEKSRSLAQLQGSTLQTLEGKNYGEEQELTLIQAVSEVDLIDAPIMSFSDLRKFQTPDIESLIKFKGEQNANSLIFSILLKEIRTFEFDMSESLIEVLASQLIAQFPGFKVGDIKLMMVQILTGQHGKIYGKLQLDKFFGEDGYIVSYINKKAEIIELDHHKRKNDYLNDEKKGIPMPEKYKGFRDKLVSRIETKKRRIAYQSLRHYCSETGRDFIDFWIKFIDKIKTEYPHSKFAHIMSWKQYKNKRQKDFLFAANKACNQ